MDQKNSRSLSRELEWFEWVMNQCLEAYFQKVEGLEDLILKHLPELETDDSEYARFLKKHQFNWEERLIICLALAPHLKPQSLDIFLTTNPLFDQPFTEFGGYRSNGSNGFLPTGETAAFLLSRGNLLRRFDLVKVFAPQHVFAREQILSLEKKNADAPLLSGKLLVGEGFWRLLQEDHAFLAEASSHFPAQRITTQLEWDDLVVSPFVMEELQLLKSWITHENDLMQDPNFNKHVKPGYRSLFYGPPGTGKSMAAMLLGKSSRLEVYRIDLSLIVSKYIGETEKNLSKVFDAAEKRQWILFFDEADALFGKRTQTKSSNDRFANQEVAYLLQRVEDFPGVIILASNLKSNMDEAFSRRFQSTVYFPMPDKNQRLQLWKKVFSGNIAPHPDCDLEAIAEKYELSGGSMINVLRYSTLKTVQTGGKQIVQSDILAGIRKEFQKYGKTI